MTVRGSQVSFGKPFSHPAQPWQSVFAKKAQDSRFQGVGRYEDGEVYWNNFFVNTDKISNGPFDGYL